MSQRRVSARVGWAWLLVAVVGIVASAGAQVDGRQPSREGVQLPADLSKAVVDSTMKDHLYGKGVHFSDAGLKMHGLLWAHAVESYLDKVLR